MGQNVGASFAIFSLKDWQVLRLCLLAQAFRTISNLFAVLQLNDLPAS